MASAEMPGKTIKVSTSTHLSKKQDHLAAGRRKLDEFRKRRGQTEGQRLNNVGTEGLANGPNLGPINGGTGKQSHVVAQPIGANGGDVWPAGVQNQERREGSFQNFQLEQASGGESHETSIITGSIHGLSSFSSDMPASVGSLSGQPENDPVVKLSEETSENRSLLSKTTVQNFSALEGSSHEQLPSMEGTQEAENSTPLRMSEHSIPGHAFGDNYGSVLFSRKESTEVSDGPLVSKFIIDSWKRPTETRRQGLSHESFSISKEETDSDTSGHGLESSFKDGRVGSKQEEFGFQYRSSGMPNGKRVWDTKEPSFSFSQSNKLPFSDLAQREPRFHSRLLDKAPFQLSPTTATASPAQLPPSSDNQGGPSLSLSASDHSAADKMPDKQKESLQKRTEHDDFAALEQHIDDLTQEKFALQRALEAARSLAESLSQQNSALTEDFNSQGAIINQLQEDLDKKKEEVAAQSLVLSSLMMERERSQQENNSAVERSQILAGEVIALEEKVLRLRSSELKLQKELETLKAGNDSFRVHMTTLEKDRENLQAMLEALQEDKKLLHNQLPKALNVGDSHTISSTKEAIQRDSRDASTSTEDLALQVQNTETSISVDRTRIHDGGAPTASTPASARDSFGVDLPTIATLSADDFRAVNSIDALITELFAEKEVLLDSLRRESSRAAEFEALNNELSKKLETQTQRLELAVSQNMAYGGSAVPARSTEIEPQDNDYVDEGDEVVERVLGWIMRIFPGGSSRRQSSKLL